MILFQEKPQQTAGWKDGQTLFHRILLATGSSPTSTTAVDWHLKVKDIEDNVGLTKNYCLTVSMQKTTTRTVQFINSFFRYNRFQCLTN